LGISKTVSKDNNSDLQMNFVSGVREIIDEISVDTSEAVFRECINKLDRGIAANGKYVE
jgi:hypothetical protein